MGKSDACKASNTPIVLKEGHKRKRIRFVSSPVCNNTFDL